MTPPPPNSPLDLVALIALLLGAISGAHASGQAAPYVLTFAVAVFAAWAAAGDADPDNTWPRWRTVKFILIRSALTTAIAVGISVWIGQYTGVAWQWSLSLVAATLAYTDPRVMFAAAAAWLRARLAPGAAPPPPGDKPQ